MLWTTGRSVLLGTVLLSILCISGAYKPGYLLTMPKVLQTGMQEKVCVTFNKLLRCDVDLTIQFFKPASSTKLYSTTKWFKRGRGRCFPITIPASVTETRATVILTGGATRCRRRGRHYKVGAGYKISGKNDVTLIRRRQITFIQTDKAIYRPGQTGLGDFSLKMTPEPVLGVWKINARVGGQLTTQTFRIEEYVLPRYEVTVKAPPFLLVNAPTIAVEVCAKYTFGKAVRGTVRVKVCVTQRFRSRTKRPCATKSLLINGCAKMTFASSEIQLNSNQFSLFGAKVKVEAVVEEEGTGVTQTGVSESTKIERNLFTLELRQHSPDFYKPKLPYNGKLKAVKPDKSPAAGELIQITISSRNTGEKYERNFTTDGDGCINFQLPPFFEGANTLSVSAVAVLHTFPPVRGFFFPYQPRAFLSLREWFSRSKSFLQILPLQKPRCSHSSVVVFFYTAPPRTRTVFNYIAISRGVVVASGKRRKRGRPAHGRYGRKAHASKWRFTPGKGRVPPKPTTSNVTYVQSTQVYRLTLHLRITPAMSPITHLIVYHVRPDGETVADHVQFTVPPCLENNARLDLAPGKKTVRPGASTQLKVSAKPGSLCSIGVVDKSVQLLAGDNNINLEKLFEQLLKFNLRRIYTRTRFCPTGPPQPPPPGPIPIPLPRPQPLPIAVARPVVAAQVNFQVLQRVSPPRLVFPTRSSLIFYDASHAFNLMGVVVFTDLAVETKPCRPRIFFRRRFARRQAAQQQPVNQPAQNDQGQAAAAVQDIIRSFFPETWLWKLLHIGNNGMATMTATVPDTITQWVGFAFCTNRNFGLGVSPIASLTVFQPFFASFNLPVSVIRGEDVPISVSIFNYLPQCIVVKLTLQQENWFVLVGSSLTDNICVCGNDRRTHEFRIRPTQLGSLNLTVTAEVTNQAGVCPSGTQLNTQHVGFSDAVRRPLLVEPEGKEVEYSRTLFMCPSGANGNTRILNLDLPTTGLVPGSARGSFTVIGDVMGPALSGLDKLLRLPRGCGEQNLLLLAPNIVIMQYLTGTNQVTAAIAAKAKGFMVAGYQRQLKFRRPDGSYSAFGTRDKDGSMWLTAFTTKLYARSRPFIFIDQRDLDRSIAWFKSQQTPDGCFPPRGRVIHKSMKGGLATQGSQATLTAFVLISLLESGIDKNDTAVLNAVTCLKAQASVTDTYSQALMFYAMSLYDTSDSFRQQLLTKLNQKAIIQGGKKYWTQNARPVPSQRGRFPRRAPSFDVEMTAYCLLAILQETGSGIIGRGLPIIKWLTTQRNGFGGFSSTQDTVVGLQALASYATLVFGNNLNVNVNVRGKGISETISITKANSLILHQQSVSVPNVLTVVTTGIGCAFIQATVRFNILNLNNNAFSLQVSRDAVTTGLNKCRFRDLSICTKYNLPGGPSNMVVVALKMVTGWVPVTTSLNALRSDSALALKRFEVENNVVNFYFNELTGQNKCFKFRVEQNLIVRDTKAAVARVYDYYENEKEGETTYSLSTTCVPPTPPTTPPPTVTHGNVILPGCPICYNTLPSFKELANIFCDAYKGYVAWVQPRTRHQLTIEEELRDYHYQKVFNYLPTRFNIRSCRCSGIRAEGNVLILVHETDIKIKRRRERRKGKWVNKGKVGYLYLGPDVTVIPLGNNERKYNKILNKLDNLREDVCHDHDDYYYYHH